MMDEVSAKIKKCCAVYLPKEGHQRFPLNTIAGWLIPDSHLQPDVAKMLDFMRIGIDPADWRERILFLQHTYQDLGYEVVTTIISKRVGVVIRKKTGIQPDEKCRQMLVQASDRLPDELAKLCP